MPFLSRLNHTAALSASERYQLELEFIALRAELDDIRSAYMSLRALLVAATVVGAGYNTTATDLGTFTVATAAPARRFTAT